LCILDKPSLKTTVHSEKKVKKTLQWPVAHERSTLISVIMPAPGAHAPPSYRHHHRLILHLQFSSLKTEN
jgi:hypothetical protein